MTPLPNCSGCGQRFERESGYFLLATWAVNYGFGAVVGLAGAFLLHGPLGLGLAPTLVIISIALPVASLLAVRPAKALWLAFDHFWDPPGGVRSAQSRIVR